MVTIDRERLISEKQNNKASAEGARLLKEAMLLRDIEIYKAIPGRVSSFWTHQQGIKAYTYNALILGRFLTDIMLYFYLAYLLNYFVKGGRLDTTLCLKI